MSSEDDEIWLDALAGRDLHTASSTGLHEGRILRALILARKPDVAPAIATVDSAREAALIERARAEDLLIAHGTGTGTRTFASTVRSRSLMTSWGVRLAAALAVVAFAVGIARFEFLPKETLRGTRSGVVLLEAQDPRALKREIIGELNGAGVRATGFEQLNRVGIDADLPEPIPPKVRRVLERHHIPVPIDGALVIEIDSSTGK